jgi:hypothetical protein
MADPFGRVNDEQQARYAVEAYQRAQEEWPWADVVNYWFFKRATDLEKDQPSYYFRLLEPNFTPTLAWHSLGEYASSPEASAVETQPSVTYSMQRIRPVFALTGGALLFFWLIGYLAPKP